MHSDALMWSWRILLSTLDKWGADTADNDQYERFYRGVPPKSKGDYAFITHMIETTFSEPSQNGRVAVVAPHGVLFRGSSEGRIRQQLIQENLLDAVIGLPANIFYGTGIPVAILVFKRNKRDDSVLFIDASRDYDESNTQNKLREQDINRILETYKAREFVDKYAYVADHAEISENDYNLNIPRYVDTFEEEDPVDIPAVQRKIDQLESQLADVKTRMAQYLKELGLDE